MGTRESGDVINGTMKSADGEPTETFGLSSESS